jgi:predicted Zn-dependent peptidase
LQNSSLTLNYRKAKHSVAEIQVHQFENGLTLLGEAMPWLESAAFSISVPAGGRYDPADRPGLSNLVCEMVERGCGQRD